jgi:hypothetical protein
MLPLILFSLSLFSLCVAASSSCPSHLLVTAVVSRRGSPASIECWRVSTPLDTYLTGTAVLQLGDVRNATYVVLPPRSKEEVHNHKYPM